METTSLHKGRWSAKIDDSGRVTGIVANTSSPHEEAASSRATCSAPRVIQVIECGLLTLGNGKDTPFRAVRQYFNLDGKLLAEVDPVDENRIELERRLREVIDHNDELLAAKNELESSVASLNRDLNALIVEKQSLHAKLRRTQRQLRKCVLDGPLSRKVDRDLRARSDPRRGRSTTKGKRK